MSCFYPLAASRDITSGAVTVGYHPKYSHTGEKLELPCGTCIGCRLDRAHSWTMRIMHEAQLYDSNLFLTLDYAPEHLPKSLSLEYSDFSGFMKRVRKKYNGVSSIANGCKPIRFFVSGEYGKRYGRPHWHAILFNMRFGDEERYVNGTMRSGCASGLWRRGNVVIGDVSYASAAYCAGYSLDKYAVRECVDLVDKGTGEVVERRPPFVVMSRRPGIGHWWYEKYGNDVFPSDFTIKNGRKGKVPRYYWNKYQDGADASLVEHIRERRVERSRLMPVSESSAERREIRAQVTLARHRFFEERSL